MNLPLVIEAPFVKRRGPAPKPPKKKPPVLRIPRISRLLALALKLDGYVRQGIVKDYAEIARLGHVTRARVSQIMNLLQLAPDIQEAILFLPPISRGRDKIRLRQLRAICAELDWRAQRAKWRELLASLPAVPWADATLGGQQLGQRCPSARGLSVTTAVAQGQAAVKKTAREIGET